MNSLLLIPDISGFTQFVNETEVEHSQHIIAELLELIIDTDTLGMTVAEIEGDAILFYLKDRIPTTTELIELTRTMFINFHTHLKAFESRRICKCGACMTAHSLTLKVIAHGGPIQFLQVKDFLKPYGSDVILAHRLLKNDIPTHEYLLLTDTVLSEDHVTEESNWIEICTGQTEYEDVGSIPYTYVPLNPLHEAVPKPLPPPKFERIDHPLVYEGYIERPIRELFEVISNLDLRLSWNIDVDDMKFTPERINRVGTKHFCVIKGDLIEFETLTSDFGPDKMIYGEHVGEVAILREFALFWILSEERTGTTARLELHYHPKKFPATLLLPLFKINFKKQLLKTFMQVKNVAENYAERVVLSNQTKETTGLEHQTETA